MAITSKASTREVGSGSSTAGSAMADAVKRIQSAAAQQAASAAGAAAAKGITAGAVAGALPAINGTNKNSGGGGGGGGGAAAPSVPSVNVTQENMDNTAYAAALSAAEAARQGMPTYSGSFDQQIADLYAQINGREEFNYDLNGDAFWQQYKDKYTQQAKNAMMDTMGQAAALTGGYGSSYGQAVGQQAYDRRIEELMDIAPELYDRAYGRYQDEGNRMLQQFDMARQMANDEYGKYVDDYNRWLTERDYADDRLDAAYKQQQNNLAFLQGMIALGYTPTAQELADAGLNSAQYAAIARQYAPASGGSGGGGGSSSSGSGLNWALAPKSNGGGSASGGGSSRAEELQGYLDYLEATGSTKGSQQYQVYSQMLQAEKEKQKKGG